MNQAQLIRHLYLVRKCQFVGQILLLAALFDAASFCKVDSSFSYPYTVIVVVKYSVAMLLTEGFLARIPVG